MDSIERRSVTAIGRPAEHRAAVGECLARLVVAFRQQVDPAQAALTLSVWGDALRECPADVVAEATQRAIQSERFPPVPSVVLQHATSILRERRERAEDERQRKERIAEREAIAREEAKAAERAAIVATWDGPAATAQEAEKRVAILLCDRPSLGAAITVVADGDALRVLGRGPWAAGLVAGHVEDLKTLVGRAWNGPLLGLDDLLPLTEQPAEAEERA